MRPLSSSNTASHQALLQIIEDKEKELIQIRQAAVNAAQEEKNQAEIRLSELEQDFKHNIQVLYDKEDEIKCLKEEAVRLEKKHEAELQKVREMEKEKSKLHVLKATSEMEETLRKKLQEEFNQRLDSKQQEVERQYQLALMNEIRDRELDTRKEFEKEMMDRDRRHASKMKEMKKELETTERELMQVVYASEQKYNERERVKIEEIELQAERRLSRTLDECEREWKNRLRDVSSEKDVIEREASYIEQEMLRMEQENKNLKTKVTELIDVIGNMESEFNKKTRENQSRQEESQHQIMKWKEKATILQSEVKMLRKEQNGKVASIHSGHKSRTKAMRRELKIASRKLKQLVEMRQEDQDLIREKEEEYRESKRKWKEQMLQLKREIKQMEVELEGTKERILIEKNYEEKSKSSYKEEMKLKMEAEVKRRQEMVVAHQREQEALKVEHERFKNLVEQEKQEILREKERLETSVRVRMEQSTQSQKQLSQLQTSLNNEAKTVQQLLSEKEDINKQNMQLKDALKTLRSEMENITNSFLEERKAQVDKLEKVDSQFRQVSEERDRLIELSNKLKGKLSQKSSSNKEEVEVEELAETLWGKIVTGERRPDKGLRNSERATKSQESWKTKQKQNQKVRVRNWNIKHDE
ncbi:predicted protein [Chaetoceros tenuissimus]|uniref:Uncharacterized protein n=1 Tax=Chaetoceros tenuissimus TaxID=426638 RepID=A0AAD3CX46_9STRA|nr:predicted protein [Chaetoceros tenuissimus]